MALDVRALNVDYHTASGPFHAVHNVSFTIGKGEMVGLVGESGSGKSTIARSPMGLIAEPGRVVGGSIRLDDTELLGLRRRELRKICGKRMGFVGQDPFGALHPLIKIIDHFQNVLSAHHTARRKEGFELAVQALHAVGIRDPEHVLHGYAHELSGGMAQRVVIAIAQLLDPELLIADEPTTALDVTIQRDLMDLLRQTVDESGRSILVVTHDLPLVANYCDRVLVLYAGEVVEQGPTAEVFARPRHPYTAALLASVGYANEASPAQNRGRNIAPSVGCVYSRRCAHVLELCREKAPAERDVTPGRTVSCHRELRLWEEGEV